MQSKNGCHFNVINTKAKIYDANDSPLFAGRKADADVCLNIGASCGANGQFGVHITPDEARSIAAMLITSAEAADQSEKELAASLTNAA